MSKHIAAVVSAVLLAAAFGLSWHASPAHACAWDPDTGETNCGPPVQTCPSVPATWPSAPRVLIHTSEFLASGGTAAEQVLMTAAAINVMNQFNTMGATSARITSVATTAARFEYQKAYGDSVPTIHVGFVPKATIIAD